MTVVEHLFICLKMTFMQKTLFISFVHKWSWDNLVAIWKIKQNCILLYFQHQNKLQMD